MHETSNLGAKHLSLPKIRIKTAINQTGFSSVAVAGLICTCEMEPKDAKFSRYGRGMEWRKMGQQLLFEMLKCLLTVTESCREILKESERAG